MFKQIILPILAVAAFIVIVGIFVQKSSSLNLPGLFTPKPTAQIEKIMAIGDKKIGVQIADTAEKRKNGLSGITSLKENSGMLFVFDTKGASPLFWMKDMLIPLDLIWISNGKIVQIDK